MRMVECLCLMTDCQAQSRPKSPKEATPLRVRTLNFNKQLVKRLQNNVWRFRTAASGMMQTKVLLPI